MYDKNGRQAHGRLGFAVIKQAYLDTQYEGDVEEFQERREEALKWIKNESEEPCTFVYWCSLAGLEPKFLREGLIKARDSWELKEKLNNIFRHHSQ